MPGGIIYFIGAGDLPFVKIGTTRGKPYARLRALQTGCPFQLSLIGWVGGDRDDEKRLHETFSPVAIRGEWFSVQGKLRDFIHYIDGFEKPMSRDDFDAAIWDCVMMGMWYPDGDLTEDQYEASAVREAWDGIVYLELVASLR